MFSIVYDVWEGIDNLPGMMGSDVREKGKITGFTSGCKEAGLGLGYGIWDGITGLVTEPMMGAKRDGIKGAFRGAGKSSELFYFSCPSSTDISRKSRDTSSIWRARSRCHALSGSHSKRQEGLSSHSRSRVPDSSSTPIIRSSRRHDG